MRKAWRMAYAREWVAWDRVAQLTVVFAEANRDRKQRSEPFKTDDFHPFRRGRQKAEPRPQISALCAFEILMGGPPSGRS